MQLLLNEVLQKVSNAKTKAQKIKLLRELNSPALRSILIANFDESDRGNPDILVQFMLMGTSAFFSSILLILPASVMLYNHNIGLLAGGIFVLLSFAIMFAGIRASSSAYRTIYIDSYGV